MNPPAARSAFCHSPLAAGLLLVIAISLAWSNIGHAPFVFDDTSSIVENQSIRALGTFSWLRPPHAAGETVGGRPLLNFTFALNYAISGLNVWSYHALNCLIHAAAAFTLWSVLRRLAPVGRGVATAAALLWALHPLQTAAVSYVVQRAESLAALFVLLTVYGFLRYATAEARRTRWAVLSVIACLAGIATKETAATAPLLVMMLGTVFFAHDFRDAWCRYGRLFGALLATWLVLAALVWGNAGRGGSAGVGAGVDVGTYVLTQAWAIVHYLRVVLWPVGLTFDYGMVIVDHFSAVVVPGVLLLTAVVASGWALWRRRAIGVAGGTFFLLLAPSSSFIPVATQTIAEHRMYLALAVPVLLLCIATARASLRLRFPPAVAPVAAAIVAGLLGAVTFARNSDYASARALWVDTVAQRPENPRAHYNLGLALLAEGRRDEASRQFQHAIHLQPTHAFAQFQLGAMALTSGAMPQAAEYFAAALAADPHYVDARVNLGRVLARQGRVEEAIAQYRAALAEEPAADIRTGLAGLLLQAGRLDEAAPLVQQSLAEEPQSADAHYQWARLRERAGDFSAAESELRTALRLQPDFGAAGMALGNLLGRQQRFADAVACFRIALAAEPTNHQAQNNLANCFLALGRFPEAIAEYERILQSRPNDAAVRRNLEIARAMQAQR